MSIDLHRKIAATVKEEQQIPPMKSRWRNHHVGLLFVHV